MRPDDTAPWPAAFSPSPFAEDLAAIGAIRPGALKLHWPRTRDTDIPVWRDQDTGVILLGTLPDLSRHYREKTIGAKEEAEVTLKTGVVSLPRADGDLERRLKETGDLIRGRSVCDFGTGRGLYLDGALPIASEVHGVEIRDDLLDLIEKRLGDKAGLHKDISSITGRFDVITLFHVLEHLPRQIEMLTAIRTALKPGGHVFIEVPHARDYLSDKLDLPEYRDFIYWSEHLVLHTRDSLRALLTACGFEIQEIKGTQRYGYANHLGWLLNRKPGGHVSLAQHSSPELDRAYAAHLEAQDATDTLIAIARKPA